MEWAAGHPLVSGSAKRDSESFASISHGRLQGGEGEDNDATLPRLFSGSPYYVLEDTSPWQDNAIRIMEGE
jgi:hypothetical protein